MNIEKESKREVVLTFKMNEREFRAFKEIALAAARQMQKDRDASRLAGRKGIGGVSREMHDVMRNFHADLIEVLDKL